MKASTRHITTGKLPNLDTKTPALYILKALTPEQASVLLERNTRNRPIRFSWVNFLSQAVHSGQWMLTGEPIVFGTDGTLLDGQHRLLAIVQADKAVPVEIRVGVDPAAFEKHGQSKPRTAADVLAMDSEKGASALSAICRLALIHEFVRSNPDRVQTLHSPRGVKFFNDSYLALLQRKPLLRDATRLVLQRELLQLRRLVSRSALGYAIFCLLEVATEKEVMEFLLPISSGIGLAAESPQYNLRRQLENALLGDKKFSPTHRFSLVILAWNQFQRGVKKQYIRYDPKKNLPVPVSPKPMQPEKKGGPK